MAERSQAMTSIANMNQANVNTTDEVYTSGKANFSNAMQSQASLNKSDLIYKHIFHLLREPPQPANRIMSKLPKLINTIQAEQ